MSLEFEDLESMRRRIRDEARRRRQEELRRRREKRQARWRGSSASSLSSASSCDLLESSQPPPSPPPHAAANMVASNELPAKANVSSPLIDLREASKAGLILWDRTLPLCQRTLDNKKEQARANHNNSKFPKINLDNSDSADESGLVDISRLLAMKVSSATSKNRENEISNNEKVTQSSDLWSDDESEEEIDVRQMISRKAAEKRKLKSRKVLSSEKVSSQATSLEGFFECTPQKGTNFKASTKASLEMTSNGSGQTSFANTKQNPGRNANNRIFFSSKHSSHMRTASSKVKWEGDKPDRTQAARASRVSWQSPKSSSKLRQKAGNAANGKQQTMKDWLHSTGKPSLSSPFSNHSPLRNSLQRQGQPSNLGMGESQHSMAVNPLLFADVGMEKSPPQQNCLNAASSFAVSNRGRMRALQCEEEMQQWPCPICTLLNPRHQSRCGACDHEITEQQNDHERGSESTQRSSTNHISGAPFVVAEEGANHTHYRQDVRRRRAISRVMGRAASGDGGWDGPIPMSWNGTMSDSFLSQMLQSTGPLHNNAYRQLQISGEDVDNMSYERLLEVFGDGSENRGASSEAISSLPVSKIGNPDLELPDGMQQCSICLEDFCQGDERTSLPCLHGFHSACVNRWLSSIGTCPVCKTSVSGSG